MKKILLFCLCFVFVFSLTSANMAFATSCGSEGSASKEEPAQPVEEGAEEGEATEPEEGMPPEEGEEGGGGEEESEGEAEEAEGE